MMLLSAVPMSMTVPLSTTLAITTAMSTPSTSLCGPSQKIIHIPLIWSFICSGSGDWRHIEFLGSHHVFSWSLIIVATVRVHWVHCKSWRRWSIRWHRGRGCSAVGELPDVIAVWPIYKSFPPNSISRWPVHPSVFEETSTVLHLISVSLSSILVKEILSVWWTMPIFNITTTKLASV